MGSSLSKKFWRIRELWRKHGFAKTAKAIVHRLWYGPSKWRQINIIDHYSFAFPFEINVDRGRVESKTLLWFIPDFNVGSGGHLNIFRMISNLERKGYRSGIVIGNPSIHMDAAKAREEIREHFFSLQADVYIGIDNLPSCEFVIATGWDTAYFVRAYSGAGHKIYFVQDFEPHFYPVGTEYVLAENTYRFGFFGITAGGWLSKKLAADYGMMTHSVGFGVEQDRYRRLPRREPQVRRVFFYARPPTPRRAFELGMLVLNAVWQKMPETQFVLAGWDTSAYHVPFPHLACGTVALDDLPDLYSQCDVALVVSLTNASLLPLELMACGCNVVSNNGENVEWLLSDELATLSDPTPESLAEAVVDLLSDEVRRNKLSLRAEAFAREQTWESVTDDFVLGLEIAARHAQEKVDAVCVA